MFKNRFYEITVNVLLSKKMGIISNGATPQNTITGRPASEPTTTSPDTKKKNPNIIDNGAAPQDTLTGKNISSEPATAIPQRSSQLQPNVIQTTVGEYRNGQDTLTGKPLEPQFTTFRMGGMFRQSPSGEFYEVPQEDLQSNVIPMTWDTRNSLLESDKRKRQKEFVTAYKKDVQQFEDVSGIKAYGADPRLFEFAAEAQNKELTQTGKNTLYSTFWTNIFNDTGTGSRSFVESPSSYPTWMDSVSNLAEKKTDIYGLKLKQLVPGLQIFDTFVNLPRRTEKIKSEAVNAYNNTWPGRFTKRYVGYGKTFALGVEQWSESSSTNYFTNLGLEGLKGKSYEEANKYAISKQKTPIEVLSQPEARTTAEMAGIVGLTYLFPPAGIAYSVYFLKETGTALYKDITSPEKAADFSLAVIGGKSELKTVFGNTPGLSDPTIIIADEGELVPLMNRKSQIDVLTEPGTIETITSRRRLWGNPPTNAPAGSWDYTYGMPIEFSTFPTKGIYPTSKIFLNGEFLSIGKTEIRQTPVYEIPIGLKESIIGDLLKKGKTSEKNIQLLYEGAKAKANQIGEPVLTISPKRLRGFAQPELEGVRILPDAYKPKRLGFGGITDQLTLVFKESPTAVNILENFRKSPLKNEMMLDYFGEIANQKVSYLQGSANIPGEYGAHGATHLRTVASIGGEDLFKYHDIVKVADVDSYSKYGHGQVAESLALSGRLPNDFNSKPRSYQVELSEAFGGHEYYRPTISSLFQTPGKRGIKGLKIPDYNEVYYYAVGKFNPSLRSLSSADRIDLTRFGLKVDERFIAPEFRSKIPKKAKFTGRDMYEGISYEQHSFLKESYGTYEPSTYAKYKIQYGSLRMKKYNPVVENSISKYGVISNEKMNYSIAPYKNEKYFGKYGDTIKIPNYPVKYSTNKKFPGVTSYGGKYPGSYSPAKITIPKYPGNMKYESNYIPKVPTGTTIKIPGQVNYNFGKLGKFKRVPTVRKLKYNPSFEGLDLNIKAPKGFNRRKYRISGLEVRGV